MEGISPLFCSPARARALYARKIKAFRGIKLGVMELISGLLLVTVCVYLLLS